MYIDTFRLATEGIGPNSNTYSIAVVGYSVDVVIITPIPPSTSGGGTGAGNIANAYVPYIFGEKVKVRVTRNGIEWEEEFREFNLPEFLRDYSESVEVSYLGMKDTAPAVTFIKYMINNDNVIIKVNKL